jgi:hypothetical protein
VTEEEAKYEARKQRSFDRLGSNEPRCGMCGEGNFECLERHHVAGRKHDETLVTLCRNCHRKISVRQDYVPSSNSKADPLLAAIGQFLIGLALLFRDIVQRLEEFGRALIARSNAECVA